jgi:hypothetical protein
MSYPSEFGITRTWRGDLAKSAFEQCGGQQMLKASFSAFDPKRTSGANPPGPNYPTEFAGPERSNSITTLQPTKTALQPLALAQWPRLN